MGSVIKNGLALVDGNEFTSSMNALGIKLAADSEDDTRLGNTTHARVGGLRTFQASMKGYWDSAIDAVAQADVGTDANIATVFATGAAPAEGDPGLYFFKPLLTEYQFGGADGVNLPFSLTLDTQGDAVRGYLAGAGTKTVTGQGAGIQLGALSASQKLWAGLHVVGISGAGATVTVTIESAPTNSFAAPTTRITFTAKTAVGGQLLSVAGAITDTYWRAKWTLAGTSPSAKIYVPIGIVS